MLARDTVIDFMRRASVSRSGSTSTESWMPCATSGCGAICPSRRADALGVARKARSSCTPVHPPAAANALPRPLLGVAAGSPLLRPCLVRLASVSEDGVRRELQAMTSRLEIREGRCCTCEPSRTTYGLGRVRNVGRSRATIHSNQGSALPYTAAPPLHHAFAR
jgi:hypothetical protein